MLGVARVQASSAATAAVPVPAAHLALQRYKEICAQQGGAPLPTASRATAPHTAGVQSIAGVVVQPVIAAVAAPAVTPVATPVPCIRLLHLLPKDETSRLAVLHAPSPTPLCANLEWKSIPSSRKLTMIMSAVKRKWSCVANIGSIRLHSFKNPLTASASLPDSWDLDTATNPAASTITLQQVHEQMGFPITMVCFYSIEPLSAPTMTTAAPATLTPATAQPIIAAPAAVAPASAPARRREVTATSFVAPASATPMLTPALHTPAPAFLAPHTPSSRANAPATPAAVAAHAAAVPTLQAPLSASTASASKSLLPPSRFHAYAPTSAPSNGSKKQKLTHGSAAPASAKTFSSNFDHELHHKPAHRTTVAVAPAAAPAMAAKHDEEDGLPALPTVESVHAAAAAASSAAQPFVMPVDALHPDTFASSSCDTLDFGFGVDFFPPALPLPQHQAQTPDMHHSTPQRTSSVKKSLFASFNESHAASFAASPSTGRQAPLTPSQRHLRELHFTPPPDAASAALNHAFAAAATPNRSPLGVIFSASHASTQNISNNLSPMPAAWPTPPRRHLPGNQASFAAAASSAASPSMRPGKENVPPPPPSPGKLAMLGWMGGDSSMAIMQALNPRTLPPVNTNPQTPPPSEGKRLRASASQQAAAAAASSSAAAGVHTPSAKSRVKSVSSGSSKKRGSGGSKKATGKANSPASSVKSTRKRKSTSTSSSKRGKRSKGAGGVVPEEEEEVDWDEWAMDLDKELSTDDTESDRQGSPDSNEADSPVNIGDEIDEEDEEEDDAAVDGNVPLLPLPPMTGHSEFASPLADDPSQLPASLLTAPSHFEHHRSTNSMQLYGADAYQSHDWLHGTTGAPMGDAEFGSPLHVASAIAATASPPASSVAHADTAAHSLPALPDDSDLDASLESLLEECGGDVRRFISANRRA